MANTRKANQARKPEAQSETPGKSSSMFWPLGMLLLLIATLASAVLVLRQLDLIGANLPGCGEQSGCGKLANSVWGTIPGIGWSVSYVGFCYFLGMLIAWITNSRKGVPNVLRWIARLGALISFGFIIVMIMLESFCLYCFIAHIANFGFWIIIEMMPKPEKDDSFNAFMVVAFCFLAFSAIIALGQIQKRSVDETEGSRLQDELASAIVNQGKEAPAPTPQPTPSTPVEPPTPATPTPAPKPPVKPTPPTPATPAEPVFTGRYLYGSPSAPIKVVMISDYQCPDCFKYENQMMEILESRNDVSLSVKHYPFNSDCNPSVNSQKHANACWAARAAETAGILGGNDAFWKMHTWLFKQKGNFTNKEILGYVRTIGIDPIEFQRLINSEEVNDLIDLDVVEGEKLGVLFTPMIFINWVEMKWYHIPQRFSTTIDKVAAAINAGDPSAAPRTPPSGREKLLLDWKEGRHRSVPETTHDLKRGNPDATLQVVVWGEYTSRDYLQKLRDHLMPILEKYPDHSFSYRVFPMSNDCNRKVNIKITDYPYACLTARAIKAAIVTGTPEQAWQFHNWLIDYGIQIDDSLLIAGAAQVGLDPIQFQQALESAEVEAMVAEDVSHGIRMSFRGPPAIFVNGRYVPRWSPESTDSVLDRIMVEAIAEKQGK